MADFDRDDPLHAALLTDLYEITMAQAYDVESLSATAVFELYFRTRPPSRNFVLAAGLDDALSYLEQFKFTDEDVTYLRSLGRFQKGFLGRLQQVRFTGDVYAVPEGTVVFENEPLMQVVAPILEAQVVETFLLNQIHFQSVVASKAARVVLAAGDRRVVEFGARRAHGADAALKVARAAYLAGAAGTSLLLAGKQYGIPVVGTMAHSYVQAHEAESQAFETFDRLYPQTTLLVDTYDTLAGVQEVIALSRRRGDQFQTAAIRLDSGDLAALAKQSRQLLDEAGLSGVRIFASGGLDEYEIARLIAAGAPIDAFGVGTKQAVSADAPDLDMAYKLVEFAGQPRTKLSSQKTIYPGRKQVFRQIENGRMAGDVVGAHDERLAGEPLLQKVMEAGRRLPAGQVDLETAREHARREMSRLPETLRQLEPAATPYPVVVSERLQQEFRELQRRHHI